MRLGSMAWRVPRLDVQTLWSHTGGPMPVYTSVVVEVHASNEYFQMTESLSS